MNFIPSTDTRSQTEISIGVKLLNENAQIPTKSHHNDAGFDLYALESYSIQPKQRKVISTGISLQIPDKYAGLIWPRSGLSVKKGIDVLAGVVDAGYRGEIMVCLYNTSFEAVHINHGDRIAQIIFQEVPSVSMIPVDTLDSSQRGGNGFGSTDTTQLGQQQ
jgi:dUTP pyrophosphatase